jgi:hypothetical protein
MALVFHATEALLFCIRARPQRLRKNSQKVPKGRLHLAQDDSPGYLHAVRVVPKGRLNLAQDVILGSRMEDE